MLFSQSTTPLQYGLSENPYYTCLIGCQAQQICHIEWFEKDANPQIALPHKSVLITALPFHQIWRKVCFVPKNYPESLYHQKVIQILRQSLPVPLENLQFDYQIQPLEQQIRIAIFAFHQPETIRHSLYKGAIIDCELHCLIRAIHFLRKLSLTDLTPYCYPIAQRFARFKPDGLQLFDTPPDDVECLNITDGELPENTLDKGLYLTALGAALWNG